MSEAIEVRLARPWDVARVGQLTVEAYLHDGFLTAADDYAEELAAAQERSTAAEVWVAVDGSELVGSVTFCPPGSPYRELAREGQGEFRMLGVAPSHRGQGVARALVQRCFERCRELGLAEMVLCSMAQMTPAHALYASFGFRRSPELDWEPAPGVVLIAFRART